MGLICLCNRNPRWGIYQRAAWLWFWATSTPQRFVNWRCWIELFVELPGLILCGNRSCRPIIKFLYRKSSVIIPEIWVSVRFMRDFVGIIVLMGVLRYCSLSLSLSLSLFVCFLFGCCESVGKWKEFRFLSNCFLIGCGGVFVYLEINTTPCQKIENLFSVFWFVWNRFN